MAFVFLYTIYTAYGFSESIVEVEPFTASELCIMLFNLMLLMALTLIVIYFSRLLTNEVWMMIKFASNAKIKNYCCHSFTIFHFILVEKNRSNCTRNNQLLPQSKYKPMRKKFQSNSISISLFYFIYACIQDQFEKTAKNFS